MAMELDYESAQEAFLVGRYLKENGLNATLESFLRETPVKMVPKMPDNMQSLPQVLREFRNILKDREELKEKRRGMQQYEEILKLLFEELQDVYSFQTPLSTDTYMLPKPDTKQNASCASADRVQNFVESSDTPLEGQTAGFDFDVNDAQLIKQFCLQNSNHPPAKSPGKIIPVVLPKRVKKNNMMSLSSEGLSEVVHDKHYSNDHIARSLPNCRAEGQPVYSRGQMLAHHYNRIREHRRLNGRSKPNFLEKPMAAMSNFVAYSSLPMSDAKAALAECGKKRQDMVLNDTTQKRARSRKYVGSDIDGHCNVSACAALQSASCEESSNVQKLDVSYKGPLGRLESFQHSEFGNSRTDGQNPSAEAKLNQSVHSKSTDPGPEVKDASPITCDGNKAGESSHQYASGWLATQDMQRPHCSISRLGPASVSTVCNAAERAAVSEKGQCLERRFQKHIDCGGGLHYKAFLREKFFSARRKQGTTLHKQEHLIDQHGGMDSCCASSISSMKPDEMSQRSCRNKNDDLKGKNSTDPVDAVLLASETANLLERLLPLVADPDNMQSFISNLDFWTPRPSPRDPCTEKKWYWCQLFSESPHMDMNRAQDPGVQVSTCDESHQVEEIMWGETMDDASVLAELEEAVGQTVDEILRRHVLISPAPQPAAESPDQQMD